MADATDGPTTDDARLAEARRRVDAKKGFYANLITYVVINVIFLFVAGWDWLWVSLFWGIGLAFHAWHVFGRQSEWVRSWEQRQLQKELDRQRPGDSHPEST